MTLIFVSCQRTGDGHGCSVVVGDDPCATTHEVTVSDAVLQRLVPGASSTADTERLVRASFDYLLEREPREAILRTFDLPVIGRYFPGYEETIARALRPSR